MTTSTRGLRLLKSLERYTTNSKCYDSESVLKKMKFITASDGILKGQFTVDQSMCNMGGTAHGGYITSVIDTVCFLSQLTHPKCKIGWTTSMTVVYLAPARLGELVSVEAQILKVGDISVCDATVKNQSDLMLAKGMTSFKVATETMRELIQNVLKIDDDKI